MPEHIKDGGWNGGGCANVIVQAPYSPEYALHSRVPICRPLWASSSSIVGTGTTYEPVPTRNTVQGRRSKHNISHVVQDYSMVPIGAKEASMFAQNAGIGYLPNANIVTDRRSELHCADTFEVNRQVFSLT